MGVLVGVAVTVGELVGVAVTVGVLVQVFVAVAVFVAAPDDVMRLSVTDPPGRLGEVTSRSMTPLPKVAPPSALSDTFPPAPTLPVGFRMLTAPSG